MRGVTLLSDQNPHFPCTNNAPMDVLLKNLKAIFMEVEGVYNGKVERSYHVNGLSLKEAYDLAKEFGQESFCYKALDQWILVYVNGENENMYLKQIGEENYSNVKPLDNYTKYSDGTYFQIDFDWGNFKAL